MSSRYAGIGVDPVASPSTAAGFRRTTASTMSAATVAVSAADPSGTTSINGFLSSSGVSSPGVSSSGGPDQGGPDRAHGQPVRQQPDPAGQVEGGEERRGGRLGTQRRGDRRLQRVPHVRDAAAEDARGRGDRQAEHPHRVRHPGGEAVAGADRRGFPGGGRGEHGHGRGRLPLGRPGGGQRGAGGAQLEAAALTARAERTLRVDWHVPDLAGRAVGAAPQRPRQHEAGREAGAEAEVGQVVGAAEHVGAPGGRVEVVLHHDRGAGAVGQLGGEREPVAAQAEVDRESQRPAVAVDDPRDADADMRGQGAVERGGEDVEHSRRAGEDPVGAGHRAPPRLGDDGAVGVHDRAQHLGGPDVEPHPHFTGPDVTAHETPSSPDSTSTAAPVSTTSSPSGDMRTTRSAAVSAITRSRTVASRVLRGSSPNRSGGPASTTSCRLSAATTGASTWPSMAPADARDRSPRRRQAAATMVSRQPDLPQAQRGPAGSMTTWPISPAAQACPWTRAPPTTSPAPTPVPIRTSIRSAAVVPPKVYSPRTAVLASLAT